MYNIDNYTISKNSSLKEALIKLNNIPTFLVLFVTDQNNKLVGTLTDGDIRRGLINNISVDEPLNKFYNKDFHYLMIDNFTQNDIKKAKEKNIRILPVVDCDLKIVKLINFRKIKTLLPIDAVLMAGGKGIRLRPLTKNVPKPLLMVGTKPIIGHNIDWLNQFGIQNQYLSINYLGDQIRGFCKKKQGAANFKFIEETKPLGTIGSVSLIENFKNDYILVMNSDILTNIDFADMFNSMVNKNADIIVASSPYYVNLPYAIFQTEDKTVKSFKEKPNYTYFANAGIYIIKKKILDLIPKNKFFDATDLMESVIQKGLKLIHYPIRTYWLDIGTPEDYEKAQKDISHINFD
ncbi:MAG: nucleotidyltransferase [Bacteroidetes bacterium 4484_276]|nr:MAG: nucleotidyltransferase [Bacteroidetes bacterium 4484_276]